MSDKKTSKNDKIETVMDIIRLVESSDTSGIRAKKKDPKTNKTVIASSAYGYYQILEGTLEEINKVVRARGQKDLTLNTREEQHEAMRILMQDYDRYLRNNMGIKDPTIEDYYGVHFLGKAGYKRVKGASDKTDISSVTDAASRDANPFLKGSVGDVKKILRDKLAAGAKALKNQSKERKIAIEKEKRGYELGTKTPIDKRPGSFKNDGKVSWELNKMYNNGTNLGTHNMDYVIELGDGKAKAIRKGKTEVEELVGNYKIDDYDYASNLRKDIDLENEIANNQEYNIDAGEGLASYKSSNSRAKARPLHQLPGNEFQNKEINYQLASNADIANTLSLYSNKDNPYSAVGNQPHLMGVDENGKPIMLDTNTGIQAGRQDTQIMSTMLNNLSQPKNQQQFKLGGDMKDLQRTNQETNEGLVTFNEGGSHEENPLGGIPQNTNHDGSLNTVEEGETKHQGYVFSDSLTILPSEAEELMLPEEVEGMTYAEASEYLNKALVEHEFDPIVKRTVEKQLENLKLGNEKARIAYEANEAMEASENAAIDEELAMQDEQGSTGMSPEEIAMMEQQGGMGQGMGPEQLPSTGEYVQPSPQGDFQLDPSMMQPEQGNEHLVENPDLLNQQFRLGGNIRKFNVGGQTGGYSLNMVNYDSNFLSNPATATNPTDFNLDSTSTGGGFDANGALSKAGSVASGGLSMMNMLNTKDAVKRGEKINKGSMALQGAAAGATMGSVAGPWGTAIGAVVGGAAGLIAGGKAAKKSEKQRMFLDEAEARNLSDDFRTGSGQMESNTKELSNGGDLFNNDFSLADEPFDPTMRIGNAFVPRSAAMYNNDFSIPSYERNTDVGYDPRNNSNELNYSSNRHNEYLRESNNSEESDRGYMPPKFKMPNFKMDENPMRYLGIIGALKDRDLIEQAKWRESYIASGERYNPNYVDTNTMTNMARQAGNTSMRTLQDSAGGNSSAARANVLAGLQSTYAGINDAYIRALEYNSAQDQFAYQANQRLAELSDAAYNKEMEANTANSQAEFRLRSNANNNLYNTLAAFGQEMTDKRRSENITGYDYMGNKIKRK